MTDAANAYTPEDGCYIALRKDVPIGASYRYAPTTGWSTVHKRMTWESDSLVEVRPAPPLTVTVPVDLLKRLVDDSGELDEPDLPDHYYDTYTTGRDRSGRASDRIAANRMIITAEMAARV